MDHLLRKMTTTYTNSNTFTTTHARYLASKVAADLFQMQLFYGKPSDQTIDNYIEELVILLLDGYLDSIDYGFKKDGKWIVVISYSARFGSILTTDNRSGSVYSGADISGAYWASYLRKNSKFLNLSRTEKDRIESTLPVQREGQAESGFHSGNWVTDRSYYNGGTSLERKMFKPI